MPVEDIEFQRLSGGVLGELPGEVEAELVPCDVPGRGRYENLVSVGNDGRECKVARLLVEC